MLRIDDLNARGNSPMMPAQLARAKRPKRSTPRPIVEQLPRIDIAISISIPEKPSYLAANHRSESPFELYSINSIALDSHRLGDNYRPRPLFICNCGRSITKLYFNYGSLKCRRCANATYASRILGKRTRPILQAKRLKAFLKFKAGTGMSKRNLARLKARIPKTPSQELNSKRLTHHAIQLPQSNYGTRGAMHWR
jgi:hypothetical protein